MSKAIAVAVFDYAQVDKDTKGKLIALAGQVKRERAKHASSGMALGEAISEAHQLLAGDGRDGSFANWVEAECGFSRTSAYRYMWTWQRFGKCSSLEHFTSEALEKLATPTTPEPAVKEAMKLADKGQRINKDKATEILNRFREVANGKPKPSAPDDSPLPANQSGSRVDSGDGYIDPIEAACQHDFDDEACRKCHMPRPEPPSGKLFSRLLEHLRQAVLLLDEIAKVAPNGKLHESAMNSLDCANQDILKWRKASKK